MKLSLGQAARAAGMSKSTLQRMLASGRLSGVQRPDKIWEIDQAELQRLIDSRDAPQRGRRVAPVEAPAEARPEAVELAVLKAELQAARDRIADAIRREEAAEARAAEALARERALADRLSRLIEDQRPARGLWARLFGRDI
jgi:predicted DNA-binding protein (UPF0251 family)